MNAITGAVRAELRKYFTTRLWWGMAIAFFLVGAAFAVLFAILFTSDSFTDQPGFPVGNDEQIANSVYTSFISVGYLLMLAIGVMQIGSEYRHRTITSTFLATPKRGVVMAGKVVSLVLIGAMYGVISLVGSVAIGAVMLNLRGVDPFPGGQVFRTLALSLLVLALWALMGLGVGILISNQVAALLIGVGVAWIVEPLLGVAFKAFDFGREHIAPYLPSEASSAIVNSVQNGADDVRLSWWAAALTLLVWAAVLSGLGIARTVRQDIS